ncbi:MAG: trypsin-like peptidase domain-containing protein [Pirellulaceae bacterium]|nr:trypsin-like peptidase domain-containing protein [Pirellulaceae bacterium]
MSFVLAGLGGFVSTRAEEPSLVQGTLLAPKAFRAAAAKVQPAVVRIEGFGGIAAGADGGGYQAPGEGPTTGVVLSSDGYIVTSTFNFLRKPPIITVVTADGRRHVAQLLGRDETCKLCLLKIDGAESLAAATFAPRSEVKVGQWAIAVGVGFGGNQPALSAGIISATSRISGKAVQTDANTSPANYGGPLVDLDGRVIGICVPLSADAKSEAAGAEWYDSGIGFAVPLDGLDKQIAALKEGKTLERGYLAIQAEPTGNPPAGAVIKQVIPEFAAAKAGLLAGDQIISVGGTEILDVTHLASVIGRYYLGDKVEVLIERAKERKTIAVELGKAPPPPQPPMPKPGDKGNEPPQPDRPKPAPPKPAEPEKPTESPR